MATETLDFLSGSQSSLIPQRVSDEIWRKALDQAVIPQLAKTTPVILGENTIPTLTKRPAAAIRGEGQQKLQSDIQLGAKSFRPIKAVVGVEFTMEAMLANPGHVLDILSEEVSGALSRQIDLAVIHGRQAIDGTQLTGQEYLAQTANEVAIATANDVDVALWDGYGKVVANGGTFNGIAADNRLAALVAQARDKEGRRLYPEINMGSQGLGSYQGVPMATSNTVGGGVDASEPTNILAIGGDFEALRFGRALDIPIKRIEYGDPFGNGDLQGRNAVAFMAEVMFGWAIMDEGRFVKYTTPAKAETVAKTTTK